MTMELIETQLRSINKSLINIDQTMKRMSTLLYEMVRLQQKKAKEIGDAPVSEAPSHHPSPEV